MWEQYKKTAVFTQAVIALACVAIYLFVSHRELLPVLGFFLAMQVAAVLGAAWAWSIKRRRMHLANPQDRLPLEPRK